MTELRADIVRVDADFSVTPFKAKIAHNEMPAEHLLRCLRRSRCRAVA